MPSTELSLVAMDEPESWDRQYGESSDAYARFTIYRNLGPKRTLAAVARTLGLKGTNSLSSQSIQYNWKERAENWDFYLEKIQQAEIAELQSRLALEQFDFASDALKAVNAPVKALLDRMEKDPDAVMAEFGAQDLTKLLRLAQDSIRLMPNLLSAQRIALGQPTDITERTENVNVNYNDAQRIGDVLDVLNEAGVLDAFVGKGGSGEIIDAEDVEVVDVGPIGESEADGIPSSTE